MLNIYNCLWFITRKANHNIVVVVDDEFVENIIVAFRNRTHFPFLKRIVLRSFYELRNVLITITRFTTRHDCGPLRKHMTCTQVC